MGSSRLPGKSLLMISGKPVIEHLYDSISGLRFIEKIIVATSTGKENDAIRNWSKTKNIECYSGSETNVAERFYYILKKETCDYFIRLSADSPLFDNHVIQKISQMLNNTDSDIITTVSNKPYPSGLNMEFIRKKSFLENYPNFSASEDFEHVTNYFYRNRNRFKIQELHSSIKNPEKYKFSLDSDLDKAIISRIFSLMKKPHYLYTLSEKIKFYERALKSKINA